MASSLYSRMKNAFKKSQIKKESAKPENFPVINPLHSEEHVQSSEVKSVDIVEEQLSIDGVGEISQPHDYNAPQTDIVTTTPAPHHRSSGVTPINNNIKQQTATLTTQNIESQQAESVTTDIRKKLTRITKNNQSKTLKAHCVSKKDTQSFSR